MEFTADAASSADVVIIGGGLEGLASAWALAERGIGRIVVVERDVIGAGGTGKSSGIVRCHYGVPDLAAMALYGMEVLENAEDVLGTDVGFQQVGYVVGVAAVNEEPMRANVAMQRGLGVPVELDSPSAFTGMWPEATFDDFALMAYEPRGGFGDAYRTAMAFAARARERGVVVRQGVAAKGILTTPDGSAVVGVETSAGTISTGQVIVAAGPWSVELLAGVGITLPILAQREQILIMHSDARAVPRPVLSDLVLLQYVRPEVTGEFLVGNSDHSVPEWADPDAYQNQADWEYVEVATEKLAARFPSLPNPRIGQSYCGCYDVTPDYNPVIERSSVDGLVICAGFSGHGFKISPAVGRLVADLVATGRSSAKHIDERSFRLSRYDEGQPLVSLHPYQGAGQLR